MENFKIIHSRYDNNSFYLCFITDSCLYKKNGVKNLKNGLKVQYFKCIQCEVKGKVIENTHDFLYVGKCTVHSHEPPESFKEFKEFVHNVQVDVCQTSRSARVIYNEKLKG